VLDCVVEDPVAPVAPVVPLLVAADAPAMPAAAPPTPITPAMSPAFRVVAMFMSVSASFMGGLDCTTHDGTDR
jgi:hypothetical protein